MSDAPPAFTAAELADEAEREVRVRQWVFPKQVAAGKLYPSDADRKIAMMQEIARWLRIVAKADAAQLRLFDDDDDKEV
jgi:hypothetical protein